MFDPDILQGFQGEFLYMEPVGYLYGFWEALFSYDLHGACHIQGNLFDHAPFLSGYL